MLQTHRKNTIGEEAPHKSQARIPVPNRNAQNPREANGTRYLYTCFMSIY
nr:hypothetical protein Iba_chr09cCG10730 [Ipomoea batatas]